MSFNFFVHDVIKTDEIAHEEMPQYLDSDDPVILRTTWKPLSTIKNNFKTHRLVSQAQERLEFKISLAALLFYGFMILIGLAVLILPFIPGVEVSGKSLWAIPVGLFFTILGTLLFYFGNKKIVLDRSLMAMWRGKQDPKKMINFQDVDGYTSLKNLHAIQIIKEYIDSTASDDNPDPYYLHEINFIYDNGNRKHLLSDKDAGNITTQAEVISEFFKVPLWDGRFDGADSETLKAHGILSKLFGLFLAFKYIIFFISAASIIYFIFFQEDPNPKKDLSGLNSVERKQLEAQYTQELFDKAKSALVHLPSLDKLISSGIYVDVKDSLGRTPLFYAVKVKNRENINFFIRHGADVKIKDNQGIGLKDLLDAKEDRDLYYMIVDRELEAEAMSRGKTIYGINRTFDKEGNLISEKILER